MAFPWAGVGAFLSGGSSVVNTIGGLLGKKGPKAADVAKWNLEHSKILSEYGWENEVPSRVKAARRAGIHPIYALGGSTTGVASAPIPVGYGNDRSSGLEAIGEMGQDVGRAMMAIGTEKERQLVNEQRIKISQLGVERAELENDLLRSKLATQNAQIGPPMQADNLSSAVPGTEFRGFGEPPNIEISRPEVLQTQPGMPHFEAGAHAGTKWERTSTGWKPAASQSVYQEQDITSPAYLEWWLRNRVVPSVGARWTGSPPPDKWLPKWATGWNFNAFTGEYQPAKAFKPWEKGPNYIPRKSYGRR